jgi:hypothetical protein
MLDDALTRCGRDEGVHMMVTAESKRNIRLDGT